MNALTIFDTTKQAKQAMQDNGFSSMFSVGADYKTVKGEKLGFKTAILYMIPDYKLCPASKAAKCDKACLVSAGRGTFNSVKKARQAKSNLWHKDKGLFLSLVAFEIGKLVKKHGDTLVVRLNGTSDIDYENHSIGGNKNIFSLFPHVRFYDYTKRYNRAKSVKVIANYDLTLSFSGARDTFANSVIKAGAETNTRIAVVFRDKVLPELFNNIKVVNGDNTDLRFLDDDKVIVGLYAKGQAKKDDTGFVVDNH